MTKPRLKFNHFYRIGYKVTDTDSPDKILYNTAVTKIFSVEVIDRFLEKMAMLRRDYPHYTFWIEELTSNNEWKKFKANSMYELFSEDEPAEEKPLIQAHIGIPF